MKKKDTNENELIAQIKRSLEGYEEAYVPGSWEGFLQKRRDNRRRLFVRIASGIAACLLVGLVGLNYFQFEEKDLSKMTVEKSTEMVSEKPLTEKNTIQEAPAVVASAKSAVQASSTTSPATAVKKRIAQNIQLPTQKETTETPLATLPASNDTASKAASPLAGNMQFKTDNRRDSAISKQDSTVVPKADQSYLAIQPGEKNQNIEADPKRKVRFGVNFSPGFNSTQSTNSVNYTGGVSADISLSSHIQLSTGLQVENQSLVKEFPSIAASSTAPQNEIKRELINLDLPLNLTWKFVAEKSHAYYVSAGISSLVHLKQEDRNTTYSQDLIPISSLVNGEEVKSYSVVDQISVTQQTVDPIQTFDFAGRINLMVGFEKKLTNRFFIHIEPYTKIPTSGQSAGSFNYTTSGINFKVSF